MIQVEHLTKHYGPVPAIEDVSFSVEKGQIVGFLGPNGAGKSTTMRILSCFMPATGGSARVAGFDVFTQSMEVRRRIGYLPENAPLYSDLPVARYLDFVAEAKRVGRAERRARVAEVILDEPTIGLDPKQIAEIRTLIRSLAGQHTVILSTHILPEVSVVCDGVIIINRGRIVAQGTQTELVGQFFPTARVEVEVAGPAEAVAAAIQSLPGVLRVDRRAGRDGAAAFLVESPRDRDVRADLVHTVTARGWTLLELHQVGMSLEEVFIRVVAGEEADVGASAAPDAGAEAAEVPAERV
jgi:ABC-2 type transport system ATP-binding protein